MLFSCRLRVTRDCDVYKRAIMIYFDVADPVKIKDIAWFAIAVITLVIAKKKVDVAIRAIKHNAQMVSYAHALGAHQSACGLAFALAPEVEECLIEIYEKYECINDIFEKKLTSIPESCLSLYLGNEVYVANLGNISSLNSDASSFLVSFYKLLKRSEMDILTARSEIVDNKNPQGVEYLKDIYISLMKMGIRAYVELIHTGYESDMSIITSGYDHYLNSEEQKELISKKYIEALAIVKGRYALIDSANIIEHALGKEMRKKYDNLDVQIATEQEYFSK